MRNYQIDDFFAEVAEPLDVVVDKKVSLLYDLCILVEGRRQHQGDEREYAVRKVLGNCKSEHQMSNVLHDVVLGNCTLDTMLKLKGVM